MSEHNLLSDLKNGRNWKDERLEEAAGRRSVWILRLFAVFTGLLVLAYLLTDWETGAVKLYLWFGVRFCLLLFFCGLTMFLYHGCTNGIILNYSRRMRCGLIVLDCALAGFLAWTCMERLFGRIWLSLLSAAVWTGAIFGIFYLLYSNFLKESAEEITERETEQCRKNKNGLRILLMIFVFLPPAGLIYQAAAPDQNILAVSTGLAKIVQQKGMKREVYGVDMNEDGKPDNCLIWNTDRPHGVRQLCISWDGMTGSMIRALLQQDDNWYIFQETWQKIEDVYPEQKAAAALNRMGVPMAAWMEEIASGREEEGSWYEITLKKRYRDRGIGLEETDRVRERRLYYGMDPYGFLKEYREILTCRRGEMRIEKQVGVKILNYNLEQVEIEMEKRMEHPEQNYNSSVQ
ncbi:hypothetical protein [Anaerolentibacter hominis]|uniref:hypothetical protein n=1 Tax=Anaerolentibacter hominis TaxID=3079009 RepID=UPI0031B80452